MLTPKRINKPAIHMTKSRDKQETKSIITGFKGKLAEFYENGEYNASACITWCIETASTEDNKFNVGTALFSKSGEYKQLIHVINILKEQNFFKFLQHEKKSKFWSYSYFHIIAWLNTLNNYNEYFNQLVDILYEIGCDPFAENSHKENAFKSVMTNTQISEEERKMRYLSFANKMTMKIISKNIKSIFNIGSMDIQFINRLRFLMCLKPTETLKIMADIFVLRTIPPKCNTRDMHIGNHITLLLTMLSGIDERYKNVNFGNTAFNIYLENCNKPLPLLNESLKQLCKSAKLRALIIDENITDVEIITQHKINQEFNLQALAIFIGELAKAGICMDEYETMILTALQPPPQEMIAEISAEIRAKMAIRAIVQSQIMSTEIKTAIKEFPPVSSFITFTFESLQDKHNNQPKEQPTEEIHPFFTNMKPKNYEEVLEDTMYTLNTMVKKDPSNKQEILKQAITSLLENSSQIILKNINNITNELLKLFKKQDIIKIQPFIMSNLDEISIDSPDAKKVWQNLYKIITA
jgi:hypothetical protein